MGSTVSTSRAVASSKVRCVVPSHSSSWTGRKPPGPAASTLRSLTCRKRRRRRTSALAERSSRHSVTLLEGSAVALYQGGMSTPNCQRSRFFAAEAR